VALGAKWLGDVGPDAHEIIQLAWESVPTADRALLEAIGASQWQVTTGPLGDAAHALLRSAGHPGLAVAVRDELNKALGVWLRELRVVLIWADHPKLKGLDRQSREAFLSRVAWHEWAHALSVVRCTDDDVAAGDKLLALAPEGVRRRIRDAGYPRKDLTYEVVAESYALLMVRRLAGRRGRPSWLNQEIYGLLVRVTGWSD
jgi:hypothetical protein